MVEAAGPIGRSLKRLDDERLLLGNGQFIDDLQPEGHLHVSLLRSPIASGRIAGLDASAARSATGVLAVFTAPDLEGTCSPLTVHLTTPGAVSPPRPILASDRVRFTGEIVAAVVAGSRYQAEDARELIRLDIDPSPAVTTFEGAMAAGAPLVHDSVPGNLYFVGRRSLGEVRSAFAEADLVVEGEVNHPRVSAAPIEGRGVMAMPDGAGGVVVWSSTQVPHLAAGAIAETLTLDAGQVRVVAADVGGGFGIKAQVYPEEILLAWIARGMSKAVKWTEARSEHFQAASHARDQSIRFSAAVRHDGRVLGLRATVLSNIGAYGIRPFGPLLDPMTCAGLIPGPYDIRNYEYESYAIATNKCPEGPYRGVGIGIGSYVEFTGAGSSTFEGRGMADIPGTDTARLWLGEDGRVHLQTTCPAIGQGVHTTFAQVAAASLGVEPENIVVEQTDTSRVGPGTGAFMSRGSVTAATSAYRAGGLLREAILNAASWRLDQPVERLSIGASVILIDGQRSSITLAQLAASDLAGNGGHALDASVTYDAVQASHPYATHVCLVEVDAETGAVRILGYVVAEDCGILINPMIVEGQVVGGIAQGLGAVLMEEIVYDSDGQLLSGTFMDYLIPSASEVPLVAITHLVTPSTVHELGTKGAGEGGTIGATAALANAIADALSLSDLTLPLTPDRIIALIR